MTTWPELRAYIIRALLWIDCWITDHWLGYDWEYYSARLGLSARKHGGRVPWKEHRWRAGLIRVLNWLDPQHCEQAINAKPPPRRWKW